MLTVTKLGAFGADVTGIDLAGDLSPATMKEIVDAVVDHHVARFPKQALDKAAYDRFGRLWGSPIDFFFTQDLDPAYPALIRISNSPELDPGRHNGAAFWHTDGSYEHLPANFTMLYALEAPEQGGETRFVDMSAAHDALPEAAKARIADLRVKQDRKSVV